MFGSASAEEEGMPMLACVYDDIKDTTISSSTPARSGRVEPSTFVHPSLFRFGYLLSSRPSSALP